MTAWLSEWLRDIVLIILVATFVDLLIPNNSLERYVKVVVSLIVLLTILSPVISFLKQDKTINQVLEQASGRKDESRSLNLILANGANLRSENDRHSTVLTEQQVGEMMKEQLESSLALSVKEVVVTITAEEGISPSIEQVQVVIHSEGDTAKDNKLVASKQEVNVDQVFPVTVKVRLEHSEQKAETLTSDQAERSPMQHKLEEQVIHQIVEQWGLTANRIRVKWR